MIDYKRLELVRETDMSLRELAALYSEFKDQEFRIIEACKDDDFPTWNYGTLGFDLYTTIEEELPNFLSQNSIPKDDLLINEELQLYTFFKKYYDEQKYNSLNDDDQLGVFNDRDMIDFYNNHPLNDFSEKKLLGILRTMEETFGIKKENYINLYFRNREKKLTNSIVFGSTSKKPFIDYVGPYTTRYVSEQDAFSEWFIYNRDLPGKGLTISELISWVEENRGYSEEELLTTLRNVCSSAEKVIFDVYQKNFWKYDVPALLPQYIYNYSIVNKINRESKGLKEIFQISDFVMFFPFDNKVIIELDDLRHYVQVDQSGNPIPYYSFNDKTSNGRELEGLLKDKSMKNLPSINKGGAHYLADRERYAIGVRSDRDLLLDGFEVYRFGASELENDVLIKEFFNKLFRKFGVDLRVRN